MPSSPPESRTDLPADQPGGWPVLTSEVAYRGAVVDIRVDEIEAPDGTRPKRQVVEHLGAVAVVAVDADDRVLVLQQYRHPMAARLVELPAGLLDVRGEPPLETARRELAEEAGLAAARWSWLVEVATSPGVSDEVVTLYLAEDLQAVEPPADYHAHAEEADMTVAWVPRADLVDAVLAGRVRDGLLAAGVFALTVRRATDRATAVDPPGASTPMQ